ncbi:molybdenum-dependent transcriptional regulator [Photobacterium swingsii]|uniref:Molybdenum-dependent transcriptional regulator n=3 Tax=Photobacterium swingsii TaxID=680026 RepID=A0A2T3P9L5_9GAMM|nr:TOBE domain-containing protein [Photobacterium swingsii]PSW25522.1 molybdenum-dependent transcriptional regulator [Photobacterium swingsii]
MMNFDAQLTLLDNEKMYVNPRRIALLKAISQTGSISQAAKLAEISYKAAHDAIKDMNSRAEHPVIASEKGGKGGGGATLTHTGKRLVQMYELLDQIQDMGLKALNDEDAPLHSLLGVMSKFSLQTSARNQLFGRITKIENHALHDIISVELKGQQTLLATITHGSTERLGLVEGKDVVALVKGPAVTLSSESTSEYYDNILSGTVSSVLHEKHASEYQLTLAGGDSLCAINEHADDARSNSNIVGATWFAHFHSNQVILATLN